MSLVDVIFYVCVLCFWLILMMMMVVLLGVLFLVFGCGDGVELCMLLGIFIVGGLLVS